MKNFWNHVGYPRITDSPPEPSWWSYKGNQKRVASWIMTAVTLVPIIYGIGVAFRWVWEQTPHDHGAVLFWTIAGVWVLAVITGWFVVYEIGK